MIRSLLPQILTKQQNIITPINRIKPNTIRLFCTNNNNNNNDDNNNNNNNDDEIEISKKILLARKKKNKNSNIKKFLSGEDRELKNIIDDNRNRNLFSKKNQSQQPQPQQPQPQQLPKITLKSKIEKEKENILEFAGRKEIAHGIFINPDLTKSDKRLTIVTGTDAKKVEAKELANFLELDYLPLNQVLKLPNELFSYQSVLFVQPKGVTLHHFQPCQLSSSSSSGNHHVRKMVDEVLLDYTEGSIAYRTKFGKNARSPIIRAICPSKNVYPDTVLDVTGGLGKDAWVIASFGPKVTIVERNPVLIYLMENALSKALSNPNTAEIAKRITLVHKDSIEYLVENLKNPQEDKVPQVIFMDPMYQPKKTEKSLSKKDIRAIRKLVGGDRDSTTLFALSRRFASNRVVWKRPRGTLPFNPDIEFKSSDTCFYVYLKNKTTLNY
ncbi:hypothetical protein ACTFIU_001062 [Dictyostelium citrinum]